MTHKNITKPIIQELAKEEVVQFNNQAMTLMQNNDTNNLVRVAKLLNQADKKILAFKKESESFQKLKSITLNSWACYYHIKQMNEQALKILNEAIEMQEQSNEDFLALGHCYLNKCVILSGMKKHDEALEYAHKSIQCLQKQKQSLGNNPKRRERLSEIFSISFYNIAAQFQHLQNDKAAIEAYQKGYEISKSILGEKHKLSLLMKKNLKSMKNKLNSSTEKVITQPTQQQNPEIIASVKMTNKKLRKNKIKIKTQSTVKHDRLESIKHFQSDFRSNYLFSDTIRPAKNRIQRIQTSSPNMSDFERLKNIYLPEKYQKRIKYINSIRKIRSQPKKVQVNIAQSINVPINPQTLILKKQSSQHLQNTRRLSLHVETLKNEGNQKNATLPEILPQISIPLENKQIQIQPIKSATFVPVVENKLETGQKKDGCNLI